MKKLLPSMKSILTLQKAASSVAIVTAAMSGCESAVITDFR